MDRYITFLEDKVLELESRSPIQNYPEAKKSDDYPNTMDGTDGVSLAKTDALVMVPSQERKPSESGGSSVTAFLHSISNSIGLDNFRDQACQLNSSQSPHSTRNTPPGKGAADISSLPPRRTADALMTKFWIYIHPIFPVLNKDQTELGYYSLWGPESHRSRKTSDQDGIERAIFNIMLALGCQTGSEEESADHFYHRSRECYAIDAIDLPSLSVVQLLVLTGVYLQSTKYASRCWTVVGMAIRYAQYLGIDAKDEEHAQFLDVDRAIQRRVWYSCVILDRYTPLALLFHGNGFADQWTRLLSLSFNNSSMTPPQKPVSFSMLTTGSDSGIQTASQERHRLTFFVHSIALFEIVNNTLIDIYHTPQNAVEQESSMNRWWPREQLQRISAQNQALDDLSTALPDYLDPTCDAQYTKEQQDDIYQWQSYVFRSR